MELIDWISKIGANNVGTVEVNNIVFEPEFRKACESNACGKFGKFWTCPPHIGDIHKLIDEAKNYKTAIVYQSIHEIEDSYDFEGMMDGGVAHRTLSQTVNNYLIDNFSRDNFLHLGSGGCNLCEKCSILSNTPCRHPDLAMPSLEAYGIAVSDLALKTDMKYINGQNTVTYFSTILFK